MNRASARSRAEVGRPRWSSTTFRTSRERSALTIVLTKFRPNVLFEAGYALALGKPVIYTCQAGEFDVATSHFDTRQYSHVRWTEPADLRATLRDRFRALGIAQKYE